MASAALASSTNQLFDDGGGELNRHEIQSAIAKAVELRALHAALIQGTNSSSPSSSRPPLPHFSAVDYPVFTPSYEDEPFQGTLYPLPARSRAASESWDECDNNYSYSCRNVAADDQKSVTGSCAGGNNNNNNNIAVVLRASPELCKSGRALNHLAADFKSSSSSCNRFRQTGGESSIAAAAVNHKKNRVNSNIVVPLTDSHASVQSQPRSKGVMSWLFPRLRKNKNKQPNHEANFFSSNRTESDNASQAFGGESGVLFSIETLRRELRESNETRDAALAEVSETRSSLDSLRQKLEHLEGYCEELKKSLKSAARATRRSKSIDGNADGNVNSSYSIFPVSDEAMVEGFLQMASESRLSVKQFCKTLILQIDEYDTDLTIGNSNRDSNSKSFLHQLESAINEAMYLDFENSEFRRNGSPKHLDKSQDRQAKFQSFVSLRNLSWNEVLRKGTKYYSEEFSKFCDQKMSCVIAALNWTRPWPEQLLQAFFVAAKCIWLLHLLAFSFVPAIGVMRVEEGREFDHGYMEDMERQRDAGGGRRKVVKAMVMPGFYVNGGRVLRCKVLCRYYNNGHNGYASATS